MCIYCTCTFFFFFDCQVDFDVDNVQRREFVDFYGVVGAAEQPGAPNRHEIGHG